MSNDIALVPDNMKVPAHLAKRLNQQSALGSSVSSGISTGADFPRLSVSGTRWKVIKDGNEQVIPSETMSIIIVGANPAITKVYYHGAYDPKAKEQAPDCFSNDGIRPHHSVVSPQHSICQTCPQNAWGSKTTDAGQDVKACRDTKTLAFVFRDDPSNEVWQLKVSPSALKNLAKYHALLSAKGVPVECVVTTLSFNHEVTYPQVMFSYGGWVDEDKLLDIEELIGTDEVKAVTGEEEAPAPAAQQDEQEEEDLPVEGIDFLTGGQESTTRKKVASKKKVSKKKTAAKKPDPEPEEEEAAEEPEDTGAKGISAQLDFLLNNADD